MQFIRSFFKRITDDLKQKKLIPLKILFFVHASTLFVLYPYLTIHMRELGINVEETAIMSAVTPVVSIVMPPLAGMLADKIGNFRLLLALSSGLGGASALLLLAVPVGRITVTFPPAVELIATCDDSAMRLQLAQDYPCQPLHPYSYDINITTLSCGFVCDVPEDFSTEDTEAITRANFYDVHLPTQHLVYLHTRSSISQTTMPIKDQSTSRIMTNDPYFNTTVIKLTDSEVFFPTPQLYHIECSRDISNATCLFGIDGVLNETKTIIDDEKLRVRISHDAQSLPADVTNYWIKAISSGNITKYDEDYDGVDSLTCKDNFEPYGEVHVQAGLRKLSGCTAACAVSTPRKTLCGNSQQQIELDPAFTFWAYLAVKGRPLSKDETKALLEMIEKSRIITTKTTNATNNKLKTEEWYRITERFNATVNTSCRRTPQQLRLKWENLKKNARKYSTKIRMNRIKVRVFIGIIGGTAFAMFEGAVIAIVREQKADYGLQRVYGSIGGMISSPLSGMLIDYASRGKGYTDFRPAFYLYAVLKVASGALMLGIDLEFKQPAQNLLEDVILVFRNIELVALFIACFIMGTAWGYIESFLFWLLQDLGASRSLMGITITVGGVAGLPLLVLSGPIIRRLGHANVIFIGFIFYAIRLLGYSLIYNPWLCLVFEALESVTSSLSFTAAVTYAARLSSTTTDTSVQGLLGGLYYGVGKGAGSLIGGYLMKFFGTRPTYQIFAGATFITGCIYYLFNKFYLRKRSTGDSNDICMKKQSPLDVECKEVKKDDDKLNMMIDAASKIEAKLDETVVDHKAGNSNCTKLGPDNIDGSSDSGVDNPAYNETESADSRKDENKVNE